MNESTNNTVSDIEVELMSERLGGLVSEQEVKTLIHNVVNFVQEAGHEHVYLQSNFVATRIEKAIKRQGAKGMIADVIVAGALLAPSFKWMESHEGFHTLEFGAIVREKGLSEGIPEQVMEPIERIIRGYLGVDTPMKEFIPKPGSPEYLVATAYELLMD